MKTVRAKTGVGRLEGSLTEDRILRWLLSQTSIEPFTVEVLKGEKPSDRGVDAIVKLSYGGVDRRFAVDVKVRASAKSLLDAAAQIQAAAPRGTFPMVVSSYLPSDIARQLLDQGVSALDLCGNIAVAVPGTWYIERLGAPNRFPDTRLVKNVFRGASSLVPRVLVSGERFRSATDLLAAIESRGGSTSLPTVSRVLRQLEDEAVVIRSPEIMVTDQERFLRLFVSSYRPALERARVAGRVTDLGAVRTSLAETARGGNFRIVGVAPERYVNFPSSYEEIVVYTTSAAAALEGIDLRTDSPFQNLIVYETDDPSVFFDPREEDGFPWAPPLEAYLRLATGDERMREMATALKPRVFERSGDDDR